VLRASIALTAANQRVPTVAGPLRVTARLPDRQFQGGEIGTAYVSSGSIVGPAESIYYEPRLPCRRVLGEAGVEELLKSTIERAVNIGAVKKAEFERVIMDTTVQEKAVGFPTDSRLLEVAREKIARLAARAGRKLKMAHEREGKTLKRKASGHAHAKQFKRLRRVLRRQRTILGSLLRCAQVLGLRTGGAPARPVRDPYERRVF
jgi:hypothetical protein